MVRVRFAPSPTGPLHIGGVRTALFNFLYARKEKGTFLIRIEDTDRERSKPEFESEILNSLKWLGLSWDESVIRQSERLGLYQNIIDTLIRQGSAYRFEENGKSAVKLKVPKQKVGFQDLVHGVIEFDTSLFEDFVIQKSDGFPTFFLACAVDDHEMGITHVIRGDDHISNTPRQILIYQALGWTPPEWGHLPLVFGADKTPLSKRHGSVSFDGYLKAGYLPEGLLNYLALLGWSPGKNREFLKLNELVQEFSLKGIHSTNACFDVEKLKWLNGEHVRGLDEDAFERFAEEYFSRYYAKAHQSAGHRFRSIAVLYKSRIRIFEELYELARFFFEDEIVFDSEAVKKYLSSDETCQNLRKWRQALETDGDFAKPAALEALLRTTAEHLKIEAKALIHPTRVAVSGRSVTPGLFEILSILGRETVLKRLEFVVEHFGNVGKG